MAKKNVANKSANNQATKKKVAKRGSPTQTKKSAKKGAKKQPTTQEPAEQAITVRMYCAGLGDCFLLSFPRTGQAAPYRILIDCGVFQSTPNESQRLRAVAQNLLTDTGGQIDLLIITHEHWDHISGFTHAHDLFQQFQFAQVWLSWAENPQDPAAQLVKAELGQKRNQIASALRAVERLGGPTALTDNQAALQAVDDTRQLMDFMGPAAPAAAQGPNATTATGANKKMTLGETMDWIRSKVDKQQFREPGECLELPDTGVKVYVLGPPKDVSAIRKMNPSGDQGYKHLAASASFHAAVDWLASSNQSGSWPPGPFDDRYALSVDQAREDPFFREYYGFEDDPLEPNGSGWRRIDGDWLFSVGQLALQLDTGVNNTSLALAFELPDGRTLIFPGDAQIGNWLSWDKVVFADHQGMPLTTTSAGLLSRAVLYKVGHHGSHNATRKAGGLESMTSDELVALIPTDEQFARARRPPEGWKMPFAPLYTALQDKTDSRIIRADFDQAQTKELTKNSTSQQSFLSRLAWSSQSLPDVLERSLYVEYQVPVKLSQKGNN